MTECAWRNSGRWIGTCRLFASLFILALPLMKFNGVFIGGWTANAFANKPFEGRTYNLTATSKVSVWKMDFTGQVGIPVKSVSKPFLLLGAELRIF